MNDARDSDDLRVLDVNGDRAFRLFRFSELAAPIMHDENQSDRKRGSLRGELELRLGPANLSRTVYRSLARVRTVSCPVK
jgi:hypothetical protein